LSANGPKKFLGYCFAEVLRLAARLYLGSIPDKCLLTDIYAPNQPRVAEKASKARQSEKPKKLSLK